MQCNECGRIVSPTKVAIYTLGIWHGLKTVCPVCGKKMGESEKKTFEDLLHTAFRLDKSKIPLHVTLKIVAGQNVCHIENGWWLPV